MYVNLAEPIFEKSRNRDIHFKRSQFFIAPDFSDGCCE